MTAQGPELRALADTLREAGERATEGPWEAFEEGDGTYEVNGPATRPRPGTVARAVVIPKVWLSDVGLIVLLRNNLLTIISALERAAAAEGEKAEAWAEGFYAGWRQRHTGKADTEGYVGGYSEEANPYRSAS